MRVIFNDLDEFLEELRWDIERGPAGGADALRVTFTHRASATLPVSTLSVEAGYVNPDGDLVTFGQRIGERFPGSNEAEKIALEGEAVVARIKATAQSLGLTVRPGLYRLE